jgi:hypothetical protein
MLADRGPISASWRSYARAATLIIALVAGAGALQGCATSNELGSARAKIAAGNFNAARQELIALSSSGKLKPDQRREVFDDLCLSDFMLGRPAVTIVEQRRACADALKEPGSQSAAIVAKIDAQARDAYAKEIDTALASRDLAGAERAAISYQATPGADPALVASWSKEIWALAEQVFADSSDKKSSLVTTVAQARKDHPDVRHMNDGQFERWVRADLTLSGRPVASRVRVKESKLTFSIDDADLPLVELNLDKLSTANDALTARCGCGARTEIAVSETGFPVYIIRVDPETRMSEVMILPRSDRPIISASAR